MQLKEDLFILSHGSKALSIMAEKPWYGWMAVRVWSEATCSLLYRPEAEKAE